MTQTAVREVPAGIITYSLAIEERIAELEAEIESSRKAYIGLSERYNELSHKYEFVQRLFEVKGDTLTNSHKASVFATVQYLREHERDRDPETGYIKMNTWEIAAIAGQDDGTLRKNWEVLSRELRIRDGQEIETDIGNVPIFDRLVVRIPTKDRQKYPAGFYLETWMKERDDTYHPERYRPQTPIEWGGKRKDAGRKKCKKCNVWMKAQDHVRTAQREHICPNCHTHEWDEVRRVTDDVVLINAPVEQPEGGKNQVEFYYSNPLDEEETEASKSQLEEVEEDGIHHQVAIAEPPPSVDTLPGPPEALRTLRIWCCHRKKEPFDVTKSVRTFQHAKSDDPSTWATFDEVKEWFLRSHRERWKEPFDGLMFANNGQFVFTDGDHCRGRGLEDEILALPTYAEESYGGDGIHSIALATVPEGRKNQKIGLEMYPEKRFFTYTGKHIAGTPDTIEPCQEAVTALYDKYFPPREKILSIVPTQRQTPCTRPLEDILERARKARNGSGEKFIRLYDYGNWSGYPSQSEADCALCEMLFYWTGGNVSTVNELFKDSGLMREKWSRDDYRAETLAKAFGFWQRSHQRKQEAS